MLFPRDTAIEALALAFPCRHRPSRAKISLLARELRSFSDETFRAALADTTLRCREKFPELMDILHVCMEVAAERHLRKRPDLMINAWNGNWFIGLYDFTAQHDRSPQHRELPQLRRAYTPEARGLVHAAESGPFSGASREIIAKYTRLAESLGVDVSRPFGAVWLQKQNSTQPLQESAHA